MNSGDIGLGILNAFQQGQQARRETDQRNAMAAYAMNPTREGLAGLAPFDPQFAMNERARFDQQDAAQRQQGQEQQGTFRRLLQHAGQSPEGWQQAIGAAQQMGIDLRAAGVPQQYDPQWAQQQLFIMDAMETPEGQRALSTAGQIAADMGFQPGTPEFAAKVSQIFNAQQQETIAYQPGGNVITYNPVTGDRQALVQGAEAPPAQSPPPPPPGFTIDGGGTDGNVGGNFPGH